MARLYEYFDVTGGGQTLSGYAFPAVHQYDATSFYNWEQDNLPIDDLTTRSDVIRQYLGLGAALSGVTLTVSAGALAEAAESGIFPTVQKALEIVPRRLRFPLLIEILDFGDLGELEISDIQCEGTGGLQIACRQFGQHTSGTVSSVLAASAYGPSASQTLPTSFSSTVLSSMIKEVSSTKLAVNCSADQPWERYCRLYYQKAPDSQDEPQTLGFAPFPRPNGSLFLSAAAFGSYNYNASDESTVLDDVHPRMEGGIGLSLIEEREVLAVDDLITVAAYGAYFRKIKIVNCSRVKLQNICVDSASGSDSIYPNKIQYLCDRGIDVRNSNILLENVAVSRVNKVGVYAQDSVINTAQSFVINRIYERKLDGTRPSEGVGLYLADSSIAFDTSAYTRGGKYLTSISKCGIGIHAINSRITGGAKSSVASTTYPKNAGGLDTETTKLYVANSNTGILLDNSVVDYEGRPEVYCNLEAIDARDSSLTLIQFSVDANQESGFGLSKSVLRYGSFYTLPGSLSATTGAAKPKPTFTSDLNGTNIYADNGSLVAPVEDCSSIPKLGWWGGSWSGTSQNAINKLAMASHGIYDGISVAASPAIVASDNSNVELTNLGFAGRAVIQGTVGACALASKNSSVVFRGTLSATTSIGSYGELGAYNLKKNWTSAATAAIDNSNITFTGPTKIGRYGICVLADNNSHALFGPPSKESNSWVPESSKYDLSNAGNHTKVDLHSTRACLVANNKSTIDMVSLGGSALDDVYSVDIVATSGTGTSAIYDAFTSATSGSFVRFFPNGFTENAAGTSEVEATNLDLFTRSMMALALDSNHPLGTTGGMCVRAVGNSKINVNLVNFKCALDSEDVSGVVYNYFGTGCEWDGNATSGVCTSPTTDICDLIPSTCCAPIPTTPIPTSTTTITVTTPTTTTSTTTTTTTSTTTPYTSLPTPPTPHMFDEGIYAEEEGQVPPCPAPPQEFACVGTQIHMWNIADTSRLHAANLLINGSDPVSACVTAPYHGPTGRWKNGAACDYYGRYGLAADAFDASSLTQHRTPDKFYNLGIFRILGSHRGYLKMYGEVDWAGNPITSQYYGGGSPLDQAGAQGYQTMYDAAIAVSGAQDVTRHVGLEGGASPGTEPVFGRGLAGMANAPGKINGMITHASMVEGIGMLWDMGQLHPQFAVPPIHLDWQGYLRNWLDESAVSVFANARHAANKKVNLLSIYRSNTRGLEGGEGRDSLTGDNPTYGVGVKSLNMFDLDRLL